jgi:uncharacterized phage-associated protein
MHTMSERQYDSTIPNFLAPLVGFRSKKAAQLCARFALHSGGTIEKLKLIKLIYFMEREFLKAHFRPILFDELFSLPHGPICSSTLNGIDGSIHSDVWEDFIARSGNVIVAKKKFSRDDLDEVSDAELEAADEVWKSLGHMTASQLRNYSHESCPEYTEVINGRVPISYREVLEAVGASEEEAEEVEREISDFRREESLLVA